MAADVKPNIWAAGPDIIPQYTSGGFIFKSVDADDWDRYYPFQLLIVEAQGDGTYKTTPWRFTLPISPEDLSISMPVADTLHATLTGVVETTAGAPFRNIAASGTMGVWSERDAVRGGNFTGGSSLVSTALAPLTNGFSQLLTGLPPRTQNEISKNTFPVADTGFYKFHQLKTFLESYLAMRGRGKPIQKGDTNNDHGTPYNGSDIQPQDLRLAFAMWKDSSVYLVKLHQFDMRRSASDPLGYSYSLQMQAFKRVDLDVRGRARSEHAIVARRGALNPLLNIKNRIEGIRKILGGAQRLVSLGTLGPLSFANEIARQVSGAIKDALGVARTLTDMPTAFTRSAVGTLLGVYRDIGSGINGVNNSVARVIKLPQSVRDMLGIDQPKQRGRITFAGLRSFGGPRQPGYQPTVPPSMGRRASGDPASRNPDEAGAPPDNGTGIDPALVLEEVPELGDTPVEEMPLTDEQRQQLATEIQSSRLLTATDYERWRTQVQDSLNNFVQSIGAWDETYNDTYGLPAPTTVQRDPTPDELDILHAINGLEQSLDDMVVYMRGRGGQQAQTANTMEYFATLALQAGIDFTVPKSKFGVPMPYGTSLERIALEYLGDADRWHEIAALNNLRAPYIDEVGFALPLLVNGVGNEIVVSSATNLFLGQSVVLTSNLVIATPLKIIAIDVEGPGQVVVTLNGSTAGFTVLQSATLRAYLPGTINSRQIIYIPSQNEPAPSADIENLPGVDINDPLLRMGGVDLLLTPKLDLVVTPWGDNPLAIGITNLNQQANIALQTKPGALLQHPLWGFNARVGTSVADVDLPSIMGNLRTLFNSDFDFAGVKSASLLKKGNTLAIDVQIGVNGYNRDIPLLLNVGTDPR